MLKFTLYAVYFVQDSARPDFGALTFGREGRGDEPKKREVRMLLVGVTEMDIYKLAEVERLSGLALLVFYGSTQQTELISWCHWAKL